MKCPLISAAGENSSIVYYFQSNHVVYDNDVISYDIPAGEYVYIKSMATGFSVPPQADCFCLESEKRYRIMGEIGYLPEKGSCQAWLIEYRKNERLDHVKQNVTDSTFSFDVKTSHEHFTYVLAFRLTGKGKLSINSVYVKNIEADFGAGLGTDAYYCYSLFDHPMDDWPYEEKHHRYYAKASPSRYKQSASLFSECEKVLELGCGPGLFLRALKQAGVDEPVGLERDECYLSDCQKSGVSVYQHDLRHPFPFLQSCSFDGIVAHHSMDYLSPISARGTIREAYRCLKPGGVLMIWSPIIGRRKGDYCRTTPLTAARLRCHLEEAGFIDPDINVQGISLIAKAHKSRNTGRWGERLFYPGTGISVAPWSSPTTILQPEPEAWDNASCRDFTILTDFHKRTHQIRGKMVGYYTGYRSEDNVIQRAVCRAVSADGVEWHREPDFPVLEARAEEGDEGGLAAGSVIALEGDEGYRMYYSVRSLSGKTWPGIGIAHSKDGLTWHRSSSLALNLQDYSAHLDLRIIALADVVKVSDGRWFLFFEGYRTTAFGDTGFVVCQAVSNDGLDWTPMPDAVLDPQAFGLKGRHVANPKCVEVVPGEYLLGVNASGDKNEFDIYYARSSDGVNWKPLQRDPIIYRGRDEYRIESLFLTQDSLESEVPRAYYFSASADDTAENSRIVTAIHDAGIEGGVDAFSPPLMSAGEFGPEGVTLRPGETTSRPLILLGEGQFSFAAVCSSALKGRMQVEMGGQVCLSFLGDGTLLIGEENVPAPRQDDAEIEVALSLRFVGINESCRRIEVALWHDSVLVCTRTLYPLHWTPNVVVGIVAETSWTFCHFDWWQPPVESYGTSGDAHTYLGLWDHPSPLLPNVSNKAFEGVMAGAGVDRVLAMSCSSVAKWDTFGQIIKLAGFPGSQVFPLMRLGDKGAYPPRCGEEFLLQQCELLWAKGLVFGFKAHLGVEPLPPASLLEWADERQLLLMLHVTSEKQLKLVDELALKYSLPILLSHFGGYPDDYRRMESAISMAKRYPNVYLVTSNIHARHILKKAIVNCPHQVLFGSDFPGEDMGKTDAIKSLRLSSELEALVMGENLLFLTERAMHKRMRMVRSKEGLLFPLLPETHDDLVEQNFSIVEPEALPEDEQDVAKAVWSAMKFKSYFVDKPWRTLIAELASGLEAKKVLEFGCNVGMNLQAIVCDVPDVTCVGLDINPNAVRAGVDKFGLDLRLGGVKELLEFEEDAFDLAFTVSVLDHISNPDEALRNLIRCTGQHLVFLEVELPAEGRVDCHFDHRAGEVKKSTKASYSWHIEERLRQYPEVKRIDSRPYYLHPGSLGPYYSLTIVWLDKSSCAKGKCEKR